MARLGASRTWIGPILLAAGAGAALAAYTWAAQYVRYVSDDFCYGASAQQLGWLGAQSNWFNTWTGRFSATALETTALQIGPGVARLLPILLIVGFVGASWLALSQIAGVDAKLALCLALVGSYAVLRTAPDVFQSIYWLTGMTTYGPPTPLMLLTAGGVAHSARQRARLVWLPAAALLCFVTVGFSETVAAVEVTALAMLTALSLAPAPWSRFRSARRGFASALAGALAGALVVMVAPGNLGREAVLPSHPTFDQAVPQAVIGTLQFTYGWVVNNADVVLLVIATCVLAGSRVRMPSGPGFSRQTLWSMLLLSVGAVALLFMCQLPAFLVYGSPPGRTLIYGAVILVGWLGAAAWWIGSGLAERLPGQGAGSKLGLRLVPVFFAAMAIVPLATALTIVLNRDQLAEQASQEETLNQRLSALQANNLDVTVSWAPGPDAMPLILSPRQQPTSDATNGVNRCHASYYGLKSLEVVAP